MFHRPQLRVRVLHVLLLLLPFQASGWTSRPAAKAPVDRATFLSTTSTTTAAAAAAAALTTLILKPVPPVNAAVDPALKGTKKDPAYETCLSKCMYECTKPKGAEQKTRQECLPECKQSCATTKEQLMKGTPIKK